jgi:hypothetical protein
MNYFETVDGLSRWFGYYCGWAARMLLVRGLSVSCMACRMWFCVVICRSETLCKIIVYSRFLLIF